MFLFMKRSFVICIAAGVEPWSISVSHPERLAYLTREQRLDAGLELVGSTLVSGLLSAASHLNDFGNSILNIFGFTNTRESGSAAKNYWRLIEQGFNIARCDRNSGSILSWELLGQTAHLALSEEIALEATKG